jgi:translation initiation factor 6
MPLVIGNILGNDQMGTFLATVNDVLFYPPSIEDSLKTKIETSLDIEMHPICIGGSNLLGALIAGNSNAIAVADIATPEDIDILTSFSDVIVMESSVNASGNLLVCNENGVIASPAVPIDGLEVIAEVMKVDVATTTIAGQDVVGSLAVANNKGVLLHPDVTESEVSIVKEMLGVEPMVGTVGFGSPMVGAGISCSDNGAIVGSDTTGPELNRIEDALGLI